MLDRKVLGTAMRHSQQPERQLRERELGAVRARVLLLASTPRPSRTDGLAAPIQADSGPQMRKISRLQQESRVFATGGLERNRTTDTRIFNVGCLRSRRFLDDPMSLTLQEESPTSRLVLFPRCPAICVVFLAGLHRNYTRADLPRRDHFNSHRCVATDGFDWVTGTHSAISGDCGGRPR